MQILFLTPGLFYLRPVHAAKAPGPPRENMQVIEKEMFVSKLPTPGSSLPWSHHLSHGPGMSKKSDGSRPTSWMSGPQVAEIAGSNRRSGRDVPVRKTHPESPW
jgi:hypothetical protein